MDDSTRLAEAYRDQRDRATAQIVQLKRQLEDIGTKLAAARVALDEKNIPRGRWRYVRMGQPAPEGDEFVMIAADDYETWRKSWRVDRDGQDKAIKDALRDLVIQR